jgi:hypothetical protein
MGALDWMELAFGFAVAQVSVLIAVVFAAVVTPLLGGV